VIDHFLFDYHMIKALFQVIIHTKFVEDICLILTLLLSWAVSPLDKKQKNKSDIIGIYPIFLQLFPGLLQLPPANLTGKTGLSFYRMHAERLGFVNLLKKLKITLAIDHFL